MLNLNNKYMNTAKLRSLTRAQIRELIDGGKSFWCQTVSERADAINYASARRLKYTSGTDDRGGFYVCALTMPPMPPGAVSKTNTPKTNTKK